MQSSHHLSRWLTLVAILIGFGLRIYDLGADSLWSDEAGQVLAAMQPSVADTLAYLRTHAGAMPMDYLVMRLFVQLSTHEFVLRWPALFWGTASMAVTVALARQVGGRQVRTATVWFVALAPSLVYYAQETRPYAALLFFSLLATYLLLRALINSVIIAWLMWGVAMGIGGYFHPYVLLTTSYGGIFILFSLARCGHAPRGQRRRLLFGFLSGITVALLLFIPGYLFFVSGDNYRYELFQYGGTFWTVTASGLGWPIHRYLPHALALMILTGIGVTVTLGARRRDLQLMALLAGVPLMVMVIFLIVLIQGYWYLPRQLIHLQPVVLIFAAIGCGFMGEQLGRRMSRTVAQPSLLASTLAALLVAIAVTLGAPRLVDGYAFPKGNGRALTEHLLALSSDRAIVYVEPGYEMKLYEFYAVAAGSTGNDAWVASLRPAVLEDLLTPMDTGYQYLIAPPAYIADHLSQLRAAGYRPLLEAPERGYLRSLWGRP